MENQMYAIVDIETTGGFGRQHRITEVAVLIHDGVQVVDTYQTLLNPERNIPSFITGLTGIHQDMVDGAPYFEEIAHDLYQLLHGKVFVAHNVNFDFQFLKAEFERVGLKFDLPKLCTIRLTRKIFPGLSSYSLGSICESKGIGIKDRHRAFGDAEATALLFGMLVEADEDREIEKLLKRNSGEAFLPPNISKEQYLSLPEAVGVYYFHDSRGQVIYVGKALNIRSRFKGHFSGAVKGKQRLKSEIYQVSYFLTGSEFLALLVEALEIKKHWPKYNRALKVKSTVWGLYEYQDGAGYCRFQVAKISRIAKPILSFQTHHEAWSYLLDMVEKYRLCPKLSGVQKVPAACYDYNSGHCHGACCGKEFPGDYNRRVEQWKSEMIQGSSSLLVREKGRDIHEQSVLLFERGVLKAYGFVDVQQEFVSDGEVLESLTQVKPVAETRQILEYFLSKGLLKHIKKINPSGY